jgi:acetoin utilization deacetylase AcuC-like enzyme
MDKKLPVFFHKSQLDFHPKYEWALGTRIKHPDSTKRAESIYGEILKHKDRFEVIQPPKIPLKAIRDAHNYQMITLYNRAVTLPDNEEFYPSVFPQRMKAKPDPTNLSHAGFYCFDSGTPLNNKTWLAAAWSASSAYDAAQAVLNDNASCAYALSRPPGHHASRDTYGGYCYFNNAAIAAKLLKRNGRVAIVDIDFHHGNGTQEIFYRDDAVFYVSVHGDPRKHFPYFCGFQSETGHGNGEGFNLNVILEDGTGLKSYKKTLLDVVIPAVKRYEPKFLVLSAGFDIYEHDPIGKFKLNVDDIAELGKVFRDLKLPTVVIQEGGYYTKDLGKNVVSFLTSFL